MGGKADTILFADNKANRSFSRSRKTAPCSAGDKNDITAITGSGKPATIFTGMRRLSQLSEGVERLSQISFGVRTLSQFLHSSNPKNIYFYRGIRFGIMSRVLANGPGYRGSIQCWVVPKTQKMLPDAVLVSTQYYKVSIKGKVNQSREWSSTLPLHIGMVAAAKGAFWSPSIKIANFTYPGTNITD